MRRGCLFPLSFRSLQFAAAGVESLKEFLDACVFRRSFLFPVPKAIQKCPKHFDRFTLRKRLHIRLECVHDYELTTLRSPPSVASDFSKSTLILHSSR